MYLISPFTLNIRITDGDTPFHIFPHVVLHTKDFLKIPRRGFNECASLALLVHLIVMTRFGLQCYQRNCLKGPTGAIYTNAPL